MKVQNNKQCQEKIVEMCSLGNGRIKYRIIIEVVDVRVKHADNASISGLGTIG